MTEIQARPATPGILVLPSSRAVSRHLGPLAWLVLEELALEAQSGGTLAVEMSVRRLAAAFGVGKEAAATALGRLVDFGLIRCQTRRRVGRYAGSIYILDADACRRAGVAIMTAATVHSPCPETPCPVVRDTAEPDTAQRDAANAIAANGTELASPSTTNPRNRRRAERSVADERATTEQSLFDISDLQPTSPTPEPLPATSSLPSTLPPSPTSRPDDPSSPLIPLTPSSQPDALAPGVRRGRVNVSGNGADGRSGLNGNRNAEAGSSC